MATLTTIFLALADCLEALERDPKKPEAYIGKYPEYQEELGLLLRLAEVLKGMPQEAAPRDEFLRDLKSRLLTEFPAEERREGR
jgi:hypothetical protein